LTNRSLHVHKAHRVQERKKRKGEMEEEEECGENEEEDDTDDDGNLDDFSEVLNKSKLFFVCFCLFLFFVLFLRSVGRTRRKMILMMTVTLMISQ
jgi:hypothetical protein